MKMSRIFMVHCVLCVHWDENLSHLLRELVSLYNLFFWLLRVSSSLLAQSIASKISSARNYLKFVN